MERNLIVEWKLSQMMNGKGKKRWAVNSHIPGGKPSPFGPILFRTRRAAEKWIRSRKENSLRNTWYEI